VPVRSVTLEVRSFLLAQTRNRKSTTTLDTREEQRGTPPQATTFLNATSLHTQQPRACRHARSHHPYRVLWPRAATCPDVRHLRNREVLSRVKRSLWIGGHITPPPTRDLSSNAQNLSWVKFRNYPESNPHPARLCVRLGSSQGKRFTYCSLQSPARDPYQRQTDDYHRRLAENLACNEVQGTEGESEEQG
jgi:hypothetical protein